jgi:hypothetical protein
MILPAKHLSHERALLTVGARLLTHLVQPSTVSSLWEAISRSINSTERKKTAVHYDAYVLTLDLLFLMGAIELQDGLLSRKQP